MCNTGPLNADSLTGGDRPPHAASIAALDTALHDVNTFSTSKMLLHCGLDESAPVAITVPHAIAAICRRGREHLPRPLWLQACDLFVQYMAGVTQHQSLEAGVCPHREILADGTEVHAVRACPRCSVFAHIFATLRDEIASAVSVRPRPPHAPFTASESHD